MSLMSRVPVRSWLTWPVTAYAAAVLLSFGWLWAGYADGIDTSVLPRSSALFVRASVWVHFAALAACAALAARAILGLNGTGRKWGWIAVGTLGVLVSAWLFVDSRLFAILGLHLNRFVIEALMQQDAFAQIGTSPVGIVLSAWPLLVLVLPHVFVRRLSALRLTIIPPRASAALLVLLLGAVAADKAAYAYFFYNGQPFVFELRNAVPVYPVPDAYTITRVMTQLLGQREAVGFTEALADKIVIDAAGPAGRLDYPVVDPAAVGPLTRRTNVIVVVAESLRASEVTPETAPFLTSLGKQSTVATQHFSGSNCTHLGIFSLMYGLNPYYFQDFRVSRTPPALISLLTRNGYSIFVSASRTMQWYDQQEFVFGQQFRYFEPEGQTHYERDRAVTDHAIAIAREQQAAGAPYLNFVYYYATHADYQHPPDTAVFTPELEGPVDYSDPSLRRRRRELLNRYRNSVVFIDREIARLVAGLEQNGSWDDTILVVTGDHGEEFYEEGRLGHNSSFNRFQTQVPLVLRVPGRPGRVINRPTSHMDVAQTLIESLGGPDGFGANFQGHSLYAESATPVYVGMAHYQRPQVFAILGEGRRIVVGTADGRVELEGVTDLAGVPASSPDDAQQRVFELVRQIRALRKRAHP